MTMKRIMAAGAGLAVIDLTEAFARHPDPTSLYAPDSHFSTAGAVSTIDQFGVRNFGQKLVIQFGTRGPDGSFSQIGPDVLPIDPGPVISNRPWRNLRIPMSSVPAGATAMRIVATDNNLDPDQWLAVTPPRAGWAPLARLPLADLVHQPVGRERLLVHPRPSGRRGAGIDIRNHGNRPEISRLTSLAGT